MSTKGAKTMLKREDYKNIKRMDRQQMDAYLQRIYMRGYEAGAKGPVIKQAPSTLPDKQEKKGLGE